MTVKQKNLEQGGWRDLLEQRKTTKSLCSTALRRVLLAQLVLEK